MGPPLAATDRVLVRLPSWLGDLVMAEPAVRGVIDHLQRAGGSAAQVTLAGPRRLLPLLAGDLPGARRLAHEGRAGEEARDWRGHDVALLLTGSFRSAWTAWRAGIPRRVGAARDGRAALLTDSLRPALERGGIPLGLGRAGHGRRFLPRPFGASCTELVGLVGVLVADSRPRLSVTDEADVMARERLLGLGLADGEGFVLASVGARPDSAKGFPAGSWAAALDGLAATGRPLVLVCGPGEEASLEATRAALVHAHPRAVVDPPAGLVELAALCARASLVLTADAGPRHVAAAVGTAVVCVAGPTDPRHTADHTAGEELVRVQVPCGPCHRERCPLVGAPRHACMRTIDPRELVDRAVELLE